MFEKAFLVGFGVVIVLALAAMPWAIVVYSWKQYQNRLSDVNPVFAVSCALTCLFEVAWVLDWLFDTPLLK